MPTVATVIPSAAVRPARWAQRLRRLALGLLIALAALTLTGLLYQAAASAANRRNYPPPGQVLDVGGFAMHLHCVGAGSPTVVLEAMSGGFSSYWGWVQPAVAAHTRVCAYDRAGVGWSDRDPQPETPERAVQNLHTLLAAAGEAGPYVLVGHSKGGLYVRQFAALYPEAVAGLVLLDAGHPEMYDRYPEWLTEEATLLDWMPVVLAASHLGVGQAYFAAGGEMDFAGLPARPHGEVAAAMASPDYWAAQSVSMRAAPSIFRQAQSLGSLGALPLAVITQGGGSPEWLALQAELAALSTDSVALTVPGSTHASLVFQPDHAAPVSAAIAAVVEAARTGQALAAR